MKSVIILCFLMLITIVVYVNACQLKTDCLADECCASTPAGNKACIKYHKLGEQCRFRSRTPVFIIYL